MVGFEIREVHLSSLISDKVAIMNPPEWLVDGVITRNSLVVLFGEPSSYKSFIALSLACHIAMEKQKTWCGKGVGTGPVLYVALEGSGGMRKRIRACFKHYEVDSMGNLWFWNEGEVNFFTKDGTMLLEDDIQNVGAHLVIIDTLSLASLGADENKNDQMAKVFDRARKLTEYGCTVLFVHHTTKDGVNYRGASAILGTADTMIEAKRVGDSVILHCKKQKDDDEFQDITLQAEPIDESLVMIQSGEVMAERMTPAYKKIWDTLKILKTANAEMLMEETKLSAGSVSNGVNWMVKTGKASKRKEGRKDWIDLRSS
jgi:RecA-family ATPase